MRWKYTVVCFIYWTLFSIYWTSTSTRSIYCKGLIIIINNIERVKWVNNITHIDNFPITSSLHMKSEWVIIFMQRADTNYPYHLEVDSRVFKGDESEIEAKTYKESYVCLFFIRSLLFACKEHAQSLLFACKARAPTHTHTHTHTHNKIGITTLEAHTLHKGGFPISQNSPNSSPKIARTKIPK